MTEKKYLLLADLPAQRERVEAVAFAFMRAAYLTDSVLFLVIDMKQESLDCYYYLQRNVFFGSCRIQVLFKNQFAPEQIIQQMDFYIVGFHPDEIFYVDAAIRHDVEIIGTRVAPEDIFSGVEVSAEVQQFKENLRTMVERELIEKFPPEQFEYFLFHEGLGESTAIFFLLKEYRKPRDKKILFLCINPLREEMMRNCPYVDVVITIPPQIFDYLTIYYADRYSMKKILTAHPSEKVISRRKSLSAEELEDYHIPEVFRDFLDIPPNVRFKKYPVRLPEVAVARAKEIFTKMNLTAGKTVFAVTKGIYFGGLEHHNEFWIKLARRLQSAGYEFVLNGDDEFFSGCKSVYLSLFETAAFVGLCRNIVSVPTGFVEAICTFNTVESINWQIIFPNAHDIFYKRKSLAARLGALEGIQKEGSQFASEGTRGYELYLKKYLDANVNFATYLWGDTAIEDDALIEKIVGRIISAG